MHDSLQPNSSCPQFCIHKVGIVLVTLSPSAAGLEPPLAPRYMDGLRFVPSLEEGSGLLGAARWGGWVPGGVCRSPAWNPARPIPKSWPTRAQSPYARHRCDQPWCVQDHTVSFFSVMGTGWWDKEERREKKKKQHMGKTQNEICWLGTQRNKAQCKAEPKQGEPWKPGLVVGSVSKALQRLSCSERWDISYIFCIS